MDESKLSDSLDTNSPSWNDVYTAEELAAALDLHSVQLAKKNGWYEIAAEIKAAADCIRDLSEQQERLAAELATLAGAAMEGLAALDGVKRAIRANVEALGKELL